VAELDALDSELVQSRRVGEKRGALRARHREQPGAAFANVAEATRGIEVVVDLAGEHILQRWRCALVWHVYDVDAGLLLEQLTDQMHLSARAAGAVAELARLCL